MDFIIGNVFIWNNFPDIRDPSSNIKPRWFIYLGKTSIFASPVIFYCATFTKKTGHETSYRAGGDRSNHITIELPKGEGGLVEDSILDLTSNFYDKEKERIDECQSDISLQGSLNESRMRQIYKNILLCPTIPKMMKIDIYNSLNLAGITNLKKPQ